MVKLPAPTDVFSKEEYQEFLDALNRRASRRAAPEAAIPLIENSEHKQTVFNCLANNWNAERVHAYLMQTVQVDIPTSAIQKYRDSLSEDDFLPVTYLHSKFMELDIEVDAVGELARLLKLKAERLDMALFLESVTHPLHPVVDQQMREYWDLLKQFLSVQKELGFYAADTTRSKGPSNVLPAGIQPDQIPTIRHLIEMVPRRRDAMDVPDAIDITAREAQTQERSQG